MITTVDCQPTFDGGVLINVLGQLKVSPLKAMLSVESPDILEKTNLYETYVTSITIYFLQGEKLSYCIFSISSSTIMFYVGNASYFLTMLADIDG